MNGQCSGVACEVAATCRRFNPRQTSETLRRMCVAKWLRPLLDSLPETIQADWIDGLPKPVTNKFRFPLIPHD